MHALHKGRGIYECVHCSNPYYRIHGEKIDDVVVIEKILGSMTPKFDYDVCSIEEPNDVDTSSIDEL